MLVFLAMLSKRSPPESQLCPHVTITKEKKKGRVVCRFASDFSGIDTGYIALTDLLPEVHHSFASDKNRACQTILQRLHRPHTLYKDVRQRDVGNAERVHLYMSTAPCTPFSSSGKKDPANHADSDLAVYALKYVEYRQPNVVIMENVPQITKVSGGTSVAGFIQSELENYGYVVYTKTIDAQDYVPQRRNRWFLVAVRRDVARTTLVQKKRTNVNPFDDLVMPPEAHEPRSLKHFIGPTPPDMFKMAPDHCELCKNTVEAELQKQVRAGVNPFETTCVIDAHSSCGWGATGVGICPTLTRTRAGGFGFSCPPSLRRI